MVYWRAMVNSDEDLHIYSNPKTKFSIDFFSSLIFFQSWNFLSTIYFNDQWEFLNESFVNRSAKRAAGDRLHTTIVDQSFVLNDLFLDKNKSYLLRSHDLPSLDWCIKDSDLHISWYEKTRVVRVCQAYD